MCNTEFLRFEIYNRQYTCKTFRFYVSVICLVMATVISRNMYLVKLKECHPRCVCQIYNRLIINNDSQKHNYICKYKQFTNYMFRPNSAIFRLEYSI